MKIALVGYGKMGREIEKQLLERGHTVSFCISSGNSGDLEKINPANTDAAIEFSTPQSAFSNVQLLLRKKIAVVCGTTGWEKDISAAEKICLLSNSALLTASNFSLGVNIFFKVNQLLARLMKGKDYKLSLEEIHHTAKKDAPSGTAVTLGRDIINANSDYSKWTTGESNDKDTFPIISKRVDPVPGTHIVSYDSGADTISIIHTAHNRTGFALGAVLAAEFIAGKQGIFTMNDVLGL